MQMLLIMVSRLEISVNMKVRDDVNFMTCTLNRDRTAFVSAQANKSSWNKQPKYTVGNISKRKFRVQTSECCDGFWMRQSYLEPTFIPQFVFGFGRTWHAYPKKDHNFFLFPACAYVSDF